MDKIGVDFYFLVCMMGEWFGVNVVFIQFFVGVEVDFEGVVDLVEMNVKVWCGEMKFGEIYDIVEILVDLVEQVEEYWIKLFEVVVEFDEYLLEKYLGGEEFIVDEIKGVICKLIIVSEIYLVLCGSVFKNKGVQLMLDVVVDYLLLLLDVLLVIGYVFVKEDEEVVCKVIIDEFFVVLVFKIVIYLFFGKFIYIWVYLGIVELGSQVINVIKGKKEWLGKLFQMYFNKENLVDRVSVGYIYVVIGFKDIIIGDILSDLNQQIVLELMIFFDLVIEVVIELKIKSD